MSRKKDKLREFLIVVCVPSCLHISRNLSFFQYDPTSPANIIEAMSPLSKMQAAGKEHILVADQSSRIMQSIETKLLQNCKGLPHPLPPV